MCVVHVVRQSTGEPVVSADARPYILPMSTPGLLTAALSGLWDVIADEHRDLPSHARIAMASAAISPRHGHERWSLDGDGVLVGLAVDAATLEMGVDAVVTSVLHDAAHVLAWRGDVQETAGRGVYHNGLFLALAEELGMAWPAGTERSPSKGWSAPTLGARLTSRLSAAEAADPLVVAVRQLRPAIDSTLPYLMAPADSTLSGRVDRITATCLCTPPRRMRISVTVLGLAPIVCGACGAQFLAR